jgi:hypothetical protein
MDDHAAIARDIAAARARIAGTAEALLYRADVKARVGDEVAGRLADARERFAGLAAAFNGNGRGSSGDADDAVAAAYAVMPSLGPESFDDAALDEGMVGEVSLAQTPRDDVPSDTAQLIPGEGRLARSRMFMPAIVAAFATAFVVWLLLSKRRWDELQDRDPA